MGFKTKSFIDDLGRVVWVAENYDNFDPTNLATISDGTDDSKDRVTKTEYDCVNNTTNVIAYNGSSSIVEGTLYLYEDSVNVSRKTCTIHPDSSDTTSSGSDQVKVAYNVDGRLSLRTDQRGTVTSFGYDNRRRPQSQQVTTLGSGTDGSVRAITRGYDSLGRVYKITTHGNQTDDPDNTADIKSQILYSFNDLGKVIESDQSHSGAVGGSTPSVQYAYDTSAVGSVFDDGARMESMTYPNGRVLFSDYGTANALEDRTGIAKSVRETNSSGAILADYSYTGGGDTVLTDYQQPDLKQDLFGGTSGTYVGLDRFGRIIDHRWYDYTSGTVDLARYGYGYENDDSGTWKEDSVAAANSVNQDEFYAYDGLRRLKVADQGGLNGGRTAISTLTFGQDWAHDQLGNWTTFAQDNDGNGTDDINQSRTHNDANEITQISASAIHIAHDAAGNMSKSPNPASWSAHYDLTWDAWNQLVKVADGANTIAEYQYDGNNRRIIKKLYIAGSLSQTRHLYMSGINQTLEERIDSSTTADRQFTWGVRYIDDLVLRTRDTDSNGSLDETLYALQDTNWNITALTDISGAVIERFAYTPYGQSKVLDANFASDGDGISDVAWEYRFTCREFDSETGLHYFRARYYHDGLGRFIGRDPLGFIDGLNLYSGYFVPNALDPMGLSGTGRIGSRKKKNWTDDWREWWDDTTRFVDDMSPEECARACMRWYNRDVRRGNEWLNDIPDCPCTKPNTIVSLTWSASPFDPAYHPGCTSCIRSNSAGTTSGQQCCYDADKNLITNGPGAGTSDRTSPIASVPHHYFNDVRPYLVCDKAGLLDKYLERRPRNRGKDKKGNPCPENPIIRIPSE